MDRVKTVGDLPKECRNILNGYGGCHLPLSPGVPLVALFEQLGAIHANWNTIVKDLAAQKSELVEKRREIEAAAVQYCEDLIKGLEKELAASRFAISSQRRRSSIARKQRQEQLEAQVEQLTRTVETRDAQIKAAAKQLAQIQEASRIASTQWTIVGGFLPVPVELVRTSRANA